MLKGFATVAYYAADLEAAEKWYAEVLGTPAYFHVPGYVEFRVGDYQNELGIIDASYNPTPSETPAGEIIQWHVDDLEGSLARLIELGAFELQPIIDRGHGFRTASVIDPFGNILGIMVNPHYVEIRGLLKPETAGLEALDN
jgi:predicted enzyme related to lactoylglutathione lyase